MLFPVGGTLFVDCQFIPVKQHHTVNVIFQVEEFLLWIVILQCIEDNPHDRRPCRRPHKTKGLFSSAQ